MHGPRHIGQAVGLAVISMMMTGIGCTYKTYVEPTPVVVQPPASAATPAPTPAPVAQQAPAPQPTPAPAVAVPQPAAEPAPQPPKPPSTIEERRSPPETVIQ